MNHKEILRKHVTDYSFLANNPEMESDVLEAMAEVEREAKKRPVKNPTTYTKFMDIYNDFVKGEVGVGAKIDGSEGKALKRIITYLVSQTGSDEAAIDSWHAILGNWDKLDDFMQRQIKLRQIESSIVSIINEIKSSGTPALEGWDGQA